MRLLILVVLGIILKLSQSFESQELDITDITFDQNVVAVLGEEVYLHCLYNGSGIGNIVYSVWTYGEGKNLKKLAGYRYLWTGQGKAYGNDGFSSPASLTDLTVKVNISSLNMEGEYVCLFSLEAKDLSVSTYLTVIVRPQVHTQTEEEVLNGTQYQSVFCSASNAKPMAQLRWEIHGAPPSDVYSIHTTNSTWQNGTASIVSVLRFPVHLNNQSSANCVVEHPALSKPTTTEVELQTFVAPNISLERVLVQKEGKDFVQVLCEATGGRPHPSIKWSMPDSVVASFSQGPDVRPESVSGSQYFSSDMYEGEVISCAFGYPHLPAMKTASVTLPIYNLTSLQLTNRSVGIDGENVLTVKEGDNDITLVMETIGNVPSYKINCTKDNEPLPKDVDVVNSHLLIKGPVDLNLAGQYHCQASYYRHVVSLDFGIRVNPLPATFHPNISVNFRKEANVVYIECSASNACPTPKVSWDFPQDLNRTAEFNITVSNSSLSVRSVLKLPACLSQNQTIECVVEHVDLKDQERRQIILPACAPIRVTLQTYTTWDNWIAYTEVQCRAENVTHDATVSWRTQDCRTGINVSETPGQVEDGVVWSSARLPVPSYAGCTVICVVHHQGLDRAANKSITIPPIGPSTSRVSVDPQTDSKFWAAVCQYEGEGVMPNISWVIADPNITALPSRVNNVTTGNKVLVKSTFLFALSQYEGKSLICVIQNDYGEEERRTVSVPKYRVLSIEVLNKTTALAGSRGKHSSMQRITLKEHVANQRILFRINGNASVSNFRCFRPSGLAASTVDMALVFPEPVLENDAGLYKCNVFWHNQKATISVQVDVTSQEEQNLMLILVCFSSALALALILIAILCVFCKKGGESRPSNKDQKKRESLAALMQDPRSPELKKAGGKGQEYAELVHYSIVIDVKTTV